MLKGTMRTKEQIQTLEDGQYLRVGVSLTEPFFMKYWWLPLTSLLPRRMNSNVITVFGLSLNIIGVLVLMFYCPMATEEAPRWAYVLAAVTLFLYQTCDALDGQQSIRYKTKRDHHHKLAEMLDHGCDSITQVCVTIELGICMQLGARPDLFLPLMLTAMLMYFTAHWQTYISGIMRFSLFDVNEGQLALCAVYMATAILGPQVWTTKVLFLEMRDIFIIAMSIMAVMKFINQAAFIWREGYSQTTAGTSIVSPITHIGTAFLLAIITMVTTNLYELQPCVLLIIFGLIEAKMSVQLMIAKMYKMEVALVDVILLGPVILLANHAMNDLLPGSILLYVVMVFSFASLIRYLAVESLLMCRLLGETCFAAYPMKVAENGKQ